MALIVGDLIPNFTAIDNNGNTFDSSSVIGKFPLVVYFYPKDDTPGCTIQACTFRDKYEDFKDLGAEVIGISSDTIKSHSKFANKYKLPFILLSDSDKKIRKAFGVANDFLGLLPGRTTYVCDKSGTVKLVFDSMSSKVHIEKALKILKSL